MARLKFIGLGVIITLGLVVIMAQNRPSQNVSVAMWDGTAFQVGRMPSLANFVVASTTTARNQIGGQIVEKGSRWSAVSQPAAGSQGTATIAAEAAVRHVADCIGFSADSTGAVTAAAGTFVVRDGATGAGTVIWSYAVAHQVAAGAGIQDESPHTFCGLNLVGTTNTAMTAEFNAGVANEVQSANISGFNIN